MSGRSGADGIEADIGATFWPAVGHVIQWSTVEELMSDIELEPEPTSPSPWDDGSTAGRTIKRYTNRKHYDSVERRYVTLQEIAALVRSGIEFKVVDNHSMEDLTSATLAQIVFEGEKRNAQMPIGLLKRLIQKRMLFKREDSPAVRAMLSTSLSAFADWQRGIDEHVRGAVEGAKGLTQLQSEFQRLHERLDALEEKLSGLENMCAAASRQPA